MSHHSPVFLFNQVLAACRIVDAAAAFTSSGSTYDFGSSSLHISRELRRTFDEAVTKLLACDPTRGTSKDALLELLLPHLHAKCAAGSSEFTHSEVKALWATVTAKPMIEYRVVRELYGATFSPNAPPTKLGAFTIFEWSRHKLIIPGDFASDEKAATFWNRGSTAHGLLAQCTVTARDNHRATEIADSRFSQLEAALRFLIGRRSDQFEIGIHTYNGRSTRQTYVFSSEHAYSNHANIGPLEQLQLDSDFFIKPGPLTSGVLSLLSDDVSALQMRILRAVDWISQAIVDPNPASATIRVATALEVLLVANEKGMITPSITSQIAEAAAQLLGTSPASCVEIESTLKSLYGLRSAVAHSGKDDVPEVELARFIHLARSVISTLLTSASYQKVQSISHLHQILKLRRYGEPKEA